MTPDAIVVELMNALTGEQVGSWQFMRSANIADVRRQVLRECRLDSIWSVFDLIHGEGVLADHVPLKSLQLAEQPVTLTCVKRYNPSEGFNCSRIYLLGAVISSLHRQLQERRQADDTDDLFRMFCERKPRNCSVLEVAQLLLDALHRGNFECSVCLVSMIYINRFLRRSNSSLHHATWRPLFLVSLMLAEKWLMDTSLRLDCFLELFPFADASKFCKLERSFVKTIDYDLHITRRQFTVFCQSLLGEEVDATLHNFVASSTYSDSMQSDRAWSSCPE